MMDWDMENGGFEQIGDRNTEWVEFNGEDIIIIDPCYILDHDKAKEICCTTKDGLTDLSRLEMLGFTKYLAKFTHDGDQSGYVINTDTDEVLGEYGVDGATWGVFKLDEVLKNKSGAENFIAAFRHMYTIIENFTGKVRIELKRKPDYNYHSESNYTKYYDSIVGVGSVNFYTVSLSYEDTDKNKHFNAGG